MKNETIRIITADPASKDAQPLLEALWAYHQDRTPVDGQYWLGVDALSEPCVTFFLAYRAGIAVGTAAYSTKNSELKSMFVADTARGTGVAAALVAKVETAARAAGVLRLETGPTHFSAIKFYEKVGFIHCERFGDYVDNGYSVCMAKRFDKNLSKGIV